MSSFSALSSPNKLLYFQSEKQGAPEQKLG